MGVMAFFVVSVLAAGCGGGGSTTGAGISQTSGTLAYVHCMRSHGVPNFPSPTTAGGIPKDKVVALVGSPRFRTAQSTCAHHLPAEGLGQQPTPQQTRARFEAALAFARCLRTRGFPNFPDPTASGQLTVQMVAAAGINLHQPAAKLAADACVSVTHGLLTRADVNRALADAS